MTCATCPLFDEGGDTCCTPPFILGEECGNLTECLERHDVGIVRRLRRESAADRVQAVLDSLALNRDG